MNTKFQLTLQPDGTVAFSCDSAEGALELAQALQKQKPATVKPETSSSVDKIKHRIQHSASEPLPKRFSKNYSKMTGRYVGLHGARNKWTDEEVKHFYELYKANTARATFCLDPILTKKHSPASVAALIMGVRNDKYIRLKYQTAFYRTYHALRIAAEEQVPPAPHLSTSGLATVENVELGTKTFAIPVKTESIPEIPVPNWSRFLP